MSLCLKATVKEAWPLRLNANMTEVCPMCLLVSVKQNRHFLAYKGVLKCFLKSYFYTSTETPVDMTTKCRMWINQAITLKSFYFITCVQKLRPRSSPAGTSFSVTRLCCASVSQKHVGIRIHTILHQWANLHTHSHTHTHTHVHSEVKYSHGGLLQVRQTSALKAWIFNFIPRRCSGCCAASA